MEVIWGNCNHGGNIVGLVFRQVGYIFKYKSNIASLDTEVGLLGVEKEGMLQKINQAKSNNEEILVPVVDWMERSDKLSADAASNRDNVEGHAKAKCSFRSFPNLFWRHRLSKDAKKMADSIASLRKSIPNDPISCSRVPPSSDDVIDGYEAFESRNSIMDQIMEALKDPEVRVVGLHGMGGSGKTMLAKEVSRRARLREVCEIDVMVTVSQIPNLHDIQQHIADKLGLVFTEKSVPARADVLRHRLRQEKKNILITLDDVWDKLDLQEIGVSFGNNQKGCKIFLTSRSAHLCDVMKAEKSTTFKLSDLTDKEARLLFDKNVGVGDSARGPDFENLAAEITKECARLPLAIVIVASALKNRELNAWKDALLQLQKATPTDIDGMIKEVYSCIMVSFKYLESKEARYLLLLCSLYAEDDDIENEDLIKYSVGLRLFSDIRRLKDVRNRVQNLVGKLKLCNLLLDGEDEMTVKMHDVVRDACLYIASRNECMHFIRDVAHLKEVESKKLEESTAISLPYEAFNQLPQKLKYPKLKLLLLRGKKWDYLIMTYLQTTKKYQSTVEISNEECFEEMKDLRVLCLINIRVNPTCFSSLKNLQTLCLINCQLQDIAPIGELNNLKILDLSGSSTFSLPREIGQLAQLQLLDLNYFTDLKIVVPHVLSNLKNLEELHMRDFRYWGEGNASTRELMDLVQLTNLDIYVPYFEILPRANDMISLYNNLERYHIIIGHWDHTHYVFRRTYSKILQLQLAESHHVKAHGLESLIKTAEGLGLKGFVDVIDISELDPHHGFPHVKSLTLERMLNLEKICSGKLNSSSFGNLKKVKVEHCNRLKSLFSFSIARQFEEIKVLHCRVLQEIGTNENEYESHNDINDTMKESQLVTLELENLPNLNRFFLPPEAETISISEKGNELFNTKVLFPKLRDLSLFRIGVVKLWPDKIEDASFIENLRILTVNSCSNLNYLFSFDVAKSLKLLERLRVMDLKALEAVIVVKEEMEVEGMEKTLFPKLHTLELCYLPNMATFCPQCSFDFPSLKTLKINECPKVSDLALIGELNNLEVLNIYGSSFVELPRGIERLTQLKSLDLSYCKPLKMIQPDVISKLIHLEELLIMPEIYMWAEGISSSGRNNASLIELKNLPKLTVLKLLVTDFRILSKDMFSEKWKVCHIKTKDSYISFNAKDSYGNPISSELELSLNKTEIEIVRKCGLQVFLKISKKLMLNGCEDVNDIVYELDKDGFPQLRELTFKNNKDAQYIVNSFSPSTPIFVRLETLNLENLTTLERICHGEPKTGSFGQLTSVNVFGCVRLKILFSMSIAIQLRELTVIDCGAMEVVVSIERENDSHDSNYLAFTELLDLKLQNLPRLVQFCSKLKTISTSHWREEQFEEKLEISMPLFDAKVLLPKLRNMVLSRIEVVKLWPDKIQDASFMQNLTKLIVEDCCNLNYLLSFDVAKTLKLLKHLKVRNLKALEMVIVVKKQMEVEMMEKKLFPKLYTLELDNLPNMATFCSQCCFEFPSLKVLRMKKCPKVEDFALIGELNNNLEVLDISESSFVEFPREIKQLTQLKSLDLSNCNSLKVIEPNVISKLVHLEELRMSKSYVAWEAEGINTGERNNASLIELKNLPNLEVLELFVIDLSFLPKCMFSKVWENCQINTKDSCISFSRKESYRRHYSSKLELTLNKREIEIVRKCGLQVLLKTSTQLMLNGFEDVNDIVYELNKDGFPQLRELTFINNKDAQYILNSFSPKTGSFGQLQKLTVKDCEAMEAIVTIEREDDSPDSNDLVFIELCYLKLINLPRLVQFCSKLKTTSTSHWREEQPEEELEISMSLFDAKVQMPQLRWLELERIDCKQIWHHQHSPAFDNLTDLCVSHCHNLKSLMSYSIAANLRFLSDLRVSDCENMEEVISTKEEEKKLQIIAFKTIAFNKLRILILENLSSLRRFSSTSTIKAPQKKTLLDGEAIVTRCDGLESLTTPSFSFHNLYELEVSKCNGLINLFDSSVVRGLLHLEKIIISECEGMTEIIGNDHESAVESEIVLKELRSLYLRNLPNLRCFYYGNSTISFPNLKKLFVRQCFEMQVFSHGIVNSPVLHSLITEVEDATTICLALAKVKEQRWEGNINSTIKKISEERNMMSSSNLNEEVTNQKDSMEYNNEDELSSKFTELSGEEVMKDSRKGKLEQATKSSSSGQ